MISRLHGQHTPAWRRMLAPVRYLLIRQGAKRAFDFGWPAAATAATIFVFVLLPVRPSILGDHGVLRGLHDLIGLLAAFFVAALAAVSTVDRKALDAPMLGAPPILYGEALSRRRFVCMLFGYLSFMAFALYLASIGADVITPSLHQVLTPRGFSIARLLLGTIYAAGFWNMVCTTLLGIWFLVERVPMPLPEPMDPALVDNLIIPPPTWMARTGDDHGKRDDS